MTPFIFSCLRPAASRSRALRSLVILAGLGLLPVLAAQAQLASSYQLAPSTGTFAPLVGGTSVPAILHDDAVSGSLPIGFSFGFEGVSYTSFRVSSNGLLGFGSSITDAGAYASNTFAGSTLGGTSLPALAPFWTDLSGSSGTGASAQYTLSGTTPSRVLTMEWLDYKNLNADVAAYLSFQVKLYETTNRIEYVYRQGPPGEAGDATIGLKGANGSFLALAAVSASPATSSTTG